MNRAIRAARNALQTQARAQGLQGVKELLVNSIVHAKGFSTFNQSNLELKSSIQSTRTHSKTFSSLIQPVSALEKIVTSSSTTSRFAHDDMIQQQQHQNHDQKSNDDSKPRGNKMYFNAAVIASMLALLGISVQKAYSCGIVAFTSENEAAIDYLLEGLHILQNRGYDSAGVASITKDGQVQVTKHASVTSTSDSIELLKEDAPARHAGDKCGIAHTRWATHGGKTDANAHPHVDYRRRLALVHNGTIENCNELKSELQALGIPFHTQTDTEVIANLIGHYLDKGMTIMNAVKTALSRLEGTWGLAIIHKDAPQQIIAARNGSPLIVGIGDKRMFVASELSAFIRHTSQYISLNDGEIAVVKANAHSLDLSRVQKAHQVGL